MSPSSRCVPYAKTALDLVALTATLCLAFVIRFEGMFRVNEAGASSCL